MNPRDAADQLRSARRDRRTLDPFTDSDAGLDEAWGYAVQALDREDRLAAGEGHIGAKLGLTSAAKQRRMNVDRPIVGFLTSSMLVEGTDLTQDLDRWVQPRIEPEIAFTTARHLDRTLELDEVQDYIAAVSVAAEVIDSRWSGYRFRLPDVVADNTSAAGVLLGTPTPLAEVGDLAALRCEVEVEGKAIHSATGAAILGNPLSAVQLLSRHLERHGESLPAGSVILAGALTDAVPLVRGSRYRLAVEQLGAISVASTGPGPADPTSTVTSRAQVATATPDRYAKQLVAHLGRKLEFATEGPTSTASVGEATGTITVADGVLHLTASGPSETAVAQVEHVLGSHLERFGQRSNLVVTWHRDPS